MEFSGLRLLIIKLYFSQMISKQAFHCKSSTIKKTADLVVCLVDCLLLSSTICLFYLCLIMISSFNLSSVIHLFTTPHRTCTRGGCSAVRNERHICAEAGECHSNKRSGKMIRHKILNYIQNERSGPLSAKFLLEYRQLIYLN